MARVTEEEVEAILPPGLAGNDLTTFIDTAHLLVNEELASAGLSADRLKQIELYMAAHFAIVTLERGGLTRQKIGESEDFYQAWTNAELGLQATRYGQQASMLDSSGKLAALAKGTLRAEFRVIGGKN